MQDALNCDDFKSMSSMARIHFLAGVLFLPKYNNDLLYNPKKQPNACLYFFGQTRL